MSAIHPASNGHTKCCANAQFDSLFNRYSPDGRVHLTNPHLTELETDTLYHLALGTDTHDLEAMFGDVKFVCMGGTVKRMKEFAEKVAKELEINEPLVDLTEASNRYSMYKVGPVLSVSVTLECLWLVL